MRLEALVDGGGGRVLVSSSVNRLRYVCPALWLIAAEMTVLPALSSYLQYVGFQLDLRS